MKETWIEKSYARGRSVHFSLATIFYAMSLFTLLGGAFFWTLFLLVQGWWHQRANDCKRGLAPVIAYLTTSWTFLYAAYYAFMTIDHHWIVLAFSVVPLATTGLLAFVQAYVCAAFVDMKGDTFWVALKKLWRVQWKRSG